MHKLSIQNTNPALNVALKKEFDDFVEKHPKVLYSFKETNDKAGNVIALEMSIHHAALYNQFIEKLSTGKLLPSNSNNNNAAQPVSKMNNR